VKRRLFVILNLSMVSGFVILGISIVSPVLPQYALSFSIPMALIGWAVSAFALARLFMDVPAGFLADRFGRKINMIIGLILIIMSSVGAGLATSYPLLILARIVEGLGSALYVTSATTWVAQISAGEARGRYMSLYSALIFAGTSFGPTIGGYSAVHFGLNAPFFIYGGFAFFGLLATIPLKEPIKEPSESSTARHSEMSLKDVPAVLLNGPFLLVNCSVFALFFLRVGVRSTLLPLYASLNLGLSEDKIGVIMMVAAIITSALAFPSGWLSDKIGRKKPIMTCLFLSTLAVLLIPLQTHLGGLIGIMALYGLATGLQGSIAAWPADVAPRGKLGTSMGAYRVIGDLGMVLGPIAVTYIAGNTGNATISFVPFLVPAVLTFIVGIMMLWAPDPAAKKQVMPDTFEHDSFGSEKR
jgi:DHA1 family multidrug resistance protein-like MFS transporter